MNPLSLIAMGIGTVGSLAGGIQSAIEAPEQRRKFLEDERRKAQILALRNSRWTDSEFAPRKSLQINTNSLDAKERQRAVQRYADEAFDWNPMSLVPFVQAGTQFAGGLYDYLNEPEPRTRPAALSSTNYDIQKPVAPAQLQYNPEQLQYFEPDRQWAYSGGGRYALG